jgi:hypothetical protein
MLPRTALLALLLLVAGCTKSAASEPPGGTMCTQDAKVCPDGSAVGRTGPNCEFAACPAGQQPGPEPAPVACTRDAKVCPDGSAVGRTGPNCEFAPCPGPSGEARACTMEAKMCPGGTSVGRTGPNCEFAPCPGK